MIERLWQLLLELWGYLGASFDPVRDTLDIVLVTLGIYWLLLLIRGTRAVQILIGLIVLIVAWMAAEMFQLVTLRLILDNFLSSAVLIILSTSPSTARCRLREPPARVHAAAGRPACSRRPWRSESRSPRSCTKVGRS